MYNRGDEVSRPRRVPLKVLVDPVAHAHRNCGCGIHVPMLQGEVCTGVPVVANAVHTQQSDFRNSVLLVKERTITVFECVASPHATVFEEVSDHLLPLLLVL